MGGHVNKDNSRQDSAFKAGTVLDLFAGCGGISLGFHAAGFELLGGVELDALAAQTHALNFHPCSGRHGLPLDIQDEPQALLRELGHSASRTKVTVLVGGPPCQAFARVGRAKLRAETHRRTGSAGSLAWLQDPRVSLYRRYLHYVAMLRPDALLMENVPDAMNHGGIDIADEVCEALEDIGYDSAYTLLNAAHFGVPQMRLRLFLIAYRKRLRVGPIRWPAPTHSHDVPSGYHGTLACATRPFRDSRQSQLWPTTHPRFQEAQPVGDHLPNAVCAEEALGDLPPIMAEKLAQAGALRRGARSLAEEVRYAGRPRHAYAHLMRTWPGFETEGTTTAHVIRYLPRDFKLFQKLRHGDDYPRAHAKAQEMFEEHIHGLPRKERPKEDSLDWHRLRAMFVPPYDPRKFPNKWRKMEPDQPARTLMAHLGKDCYSHIHYSHEQGRTISVREAARLQSFPDGFRFCGSMNAGFRQVGNAVPPLLAYALARVMRDQMGMHQSNDIRKQAGLARTSGPGSSAASSSASVAIG